jgi:hypothetical protein
VKELNLSNGVKITKAKAASATATTAVNSDVIDMAGYEGVLFATAIATANAGNFIKVQQGDAADGSDAADLEGSKVVATADGQTVWADLYRPTKRYVRLVVTRGVTTVVGEIYALQYESRKQVVNNNVAGTIIGELMVSPNQGTA